MELSIDAELYYISGVDQIKNYNESATFCGEWGGQLISDAKVVSRLGNVSSAYWVDQENLLPKIVHGTGTILQ